MVWSGKIEPADVAQLGLGSAFETLIYLALDALGRFLGAGGPWLEAVLGTDAASYDDPVTDERGRDVTRTGEQIAVSLGDLADQVLHFGEVDPIIGECIEQRCFHASMIKHASPTDRR